MTAELDTKINIIVATTTENKIALFMGENHCELGAKEAFRLSAMLLEAVKKIADIEVAA